MTPTSRDQPKSGGGQKMPKQDKKQQKRKLSQPLANVIVAGIAVIGLAVSGFVGHIWPSGSSSNFGTSTSSAPASISIDSPQSGEIKQVSTLTGSVTNLPPGSSIWVFFQSVDSGNVDQNVYPIFGPCVVDSAKNIWQCESAYIGKPKDTRMFRVCPAVLTSGESREVVELLEIAADEKKPDAKSWFDSPPSFIKPNSCMTVRRIN
jgi:hypothetical protein